MARPLGVTILMVAGLLPRSTTASAHAPFPGDTTAGSSQRLFPPGTPETSPISGTEAGEPAGASTVRLTTIPVPVLEKVSEYGTPVDRKSTRLNSSHLVISY